MNPWDLLLWAFLIGCAALIAAPGIAIALALITSGATIYRTLNGYSPKGGTK